MAKKRSVATVKQYDYSSKEEYEKDIPKMKKLGYVPCAGIGWGEFLVDGELDCEDWKYTAYFVKSTL